jgi:uncharacterized membrane protein YccC
MKYPSSAFSRLVGEVTTPGTFDPKWALFSANSFIAAMLAIYIAFRLGLERPYWAMLTVYLTSQPLAGAVRSKAVFRLFGTILGASAAVVLVPLLADEPALLSIAITGWAGLCLYISLHDRTPRSYVFMLAGYTATTVVFSCATTPEAVFDTALARVEEIVLGIGCATVVHSLLFPRDVSGVLLHRVEASVRDAGAWVSSALRSIGSSSERIARRRLAADVTEIEMLSTHVPFDTAAHRPKLWAIRALQDSLAVVLPLLSAIEDQRTALRALGGSSVELEELMNTAGDWASDPALRRNETQALLRRCDGFTSPPKAGAGWNELLTFATATRLRALIVALDRCRQLSAIIRGSDTAFEPLEPGRHRARKKLHNDSGLAALSVLALFGAVLSCCATWISTAWPDGSTAAQMAAVYVAFYGSLDDAAPSLLSFAIWTTASLPIAAIYLFVIFPVIDGFPMLVVSLAPAFFTMGYLQANPRHVLKALALLIGVIGALDLQNRFSADFASFLNVNSAEVVGIVAAFLAVRTFRSFTATNIARRLLRRGWVELAILADGRRPMNRERWLGIMLDRLGLVVSKLALSGSVNESQADQSLTALQMGLDLIDLRSALDSPDGVRSELVERLMASISMIYRKLASGNGVDSSERYSALSAIDDATRQFSVIASERSRGAGLSALVGLRRTLFPDASPFVLKETSA